MRSQTKFTCAIIYMNEIPHFITSTCVWWKMPKFWASRNPKAWTLLLKKIPLKIEIHRKLLIVDLTICSFQCQQMIHAWAQILCQTLGLLTKTPNLCVNSKTKCCNYIIVINNKSMGHYKQKCVCQLYKLMFVYA